MPHRLTIRNLIRLLNALPEDQKDMTAARADDENEWVELEGRLTVSPASTTNPTDRARLVLE